MVLSVGEAAARSQPNKAHSQRGGSGRKKPIQQNTSFSAWGKRPQEADCNPTKHIIFSLREAAARSQPNKAHHSQREGSGRKKPIQQSASFSAWGKRPQEADPTKHVILSVKEAAAKSQLQSNKAHYFQREGSGRKKPTQQSTSFSA